jgi:hypothetical protein
MRTAVTLAATLLTLPGCERQPADVERASSMANPNSEPNMSEVLALESKVRASIMPPWELLEARIDPGGPALNLRASTDALRLAHSRSDYERQNYVPVAIGVFRHYNVADPEQLDAGVKGGYMRRLASLGAATAESLAPFEIYEIAPGTIVLIDRAGRGSCIDYQDATGAPNPYLRCELLFSKYVAGFTLPAAALTDAPRAFAEIRKLTDAVLPALP